MKSFLFMIFIVFTSNKYKTQGVIVNRTKNNLTISSNKQWCENTNNEALLRFFEKKTNICDMEISDHQYSIKLDESTEALAKIMAHPSVTDDQFRTAAEKLILAFESNNLHSKAILVLERLATRFSTDTNILNKLEGLYQKIRLNADANVRADQMYRKSLRIKTHDGYNLFHRGYLIYASETEKEKDESERLKIIERGVDLMIKGLEAKDANFLVQFNFCTLDDALNRLGKIEESDKVFQDAIDLQLLSNFWQRSRNVITSIVSKPFWSLEETKLAVPLEYVKKNWKIIWKEAVDIFNQNLYTKYEESQIIKGSFHVYMLYKLGKRIESNCLNAPFTCKLVKNIPNISKNRHGDVKFTLMEADTHIASHSAPTICRLRIHIGLDVPLQPKEEDKSEYPSRIRVTNQYNTWKNGEMMIFDDSFDHEVWHNDAKNRTRLILIMDIWHPQLTEMQIATL